MSVAIRTIVVDAGGVAEMGIGSGIVHDSDPAAEYEECRLKGKFLTDTTPEFALVETMRAENGVVYLRDEHLERLRDSAGYFDFPFTIEKVLREIEAALAGSDRAMIRLRLLLHKDGRLSCESSRVASPRSEVAHVRISGEVTDSSDPFLYHKTTHRPLYDRERHADDSVDDVIFLNEKGEVTEGAISNIFIDIDGVLCTPPVSCGVLPGTLRRSLLESGKCIERVLTLDDLDRSRALYIGNSVRGLVRAACEARERRESPSAS